MHDMRIGRVTGAAGQLLVSRRANHDWVFHGTLAAGIERAHVKDINALHLAKNLQSLQTSRLLEIGRNGAGSSAGAEEIIRRPDLCAYDT